MMTHYAASAERPDYSHRFHAGNIGDVWKHTAWWGLIEALKLDPRPLDILDCHGGSGEYTLNSTGEWTAGIGKLLAHGGGEESALLAEYRAFISSFGMRGDRLTRYPGSPQILAHLRRPSDTGVCFEFDQAVYADLAASIGPSGLAARCGDGLAALSDFAARASTDRQLLALIDPPWNVKADWQTIPRTVIETHTKAPKACLAIWYPIKSYTRVAAMLKTLRGAGLPLLTADLITTPLELRRNRLNGSGVCIVNAPVSLAPKLAAAGAEIGRACATHAGFFEVREASSAG